jgi:hypothetical protein
MGGAKDIWKNATAKENLTYLPQDSSDGKI